MIAVPVGGGFGGKCDPFSHELVAAKLAAVTDRPVKITLTREEVFYAHRGRHPVLMRGTLGLHEGRPDDGALLPEHARRRRLRQLRRGDDVLHGRAADDDLPGARLPLRGRARLLTNKPPCGPKRGHGTPQPRFALECHLDKVAEELGLDPVELRLRNRVEPFSQTVNHLRITSCGLRECIEQGRGGLRLPREAREAAPRPRRRLRRQRVHLRRGGAHLLERACPSRRCRSRSTAAAASPSTRWPTDIGQGSTSVLAYARGRGAGLEPADIAVVTADTDLTPIDLGSYSSRVTFMAGNAAVEAAERMRALVLEAVAERLETDVERLAIGGGRVYDRADPDRGSMGGGGADCLGAACAARSPPAATGRPTLTGRYKGAGVGPSPAYSYTAAVVELECDPETGDRRRRPGLDRARHRSGDQPAARRSARPRAASTWRSARRSCEEQTFRDGLLDRRPPRLQDPDDARDARGAHDPRRDDRPRGPVRGEGGGPGAAAAR